MVTNSEFTPAARETARGVCCGLVDGRNLPNLIQGLLIPTADIVFGRAIFQAVTPDRVAGLSSVPPLAARPGSPDHPAAERAPPQTPAAQPPPGPDHGIPCSVNVSARVLRWPPCCACCLRPADAYLEASHTRVTGVRVIRTDARSWRVPYCKNCLRHVDADENARSITDTGATVWILGIFLAIVILTGGGILAVGLILAARAMPGAGNVTLTAGVIAIVISIACSVTMIVGEFRWSRSFADDTRRRRRRAEQKAESLVFPCCCILGPAVAYTNRYGSVHTFRFANGQYALRFAQENAGKVVGIETD